MRLWRAVALIILLVQGQAIVLADVQLIKLLRPHRIEHDGSGDYDRLMKAMLEQISSNVTVNIMPIKRSYRALLAGGSYCAVPFSLDVFLANNPTAKRANYSAGVPIDLISGHAVSRPGEPIATSEAALKGKRLAAWWGLSEEAYMADLHMTVVQTTSEEEALRLLYAERVDYAWGWIPDSLMHYEKARLPKPKFDQNLILLSDTVGIVCRRTSDTATFLQESDKILNTMRKDGHLERLLSRHARIVGVDVPPPTK